MDKTADEIEAHIDRTRERLGSHLKELEAKVDKATDWREHFRDKPYVFLGAAFVGAGMLAFALRGRFAHAPSNGTSHSGTIRRLVDSDSSAQAREFWNNVQGALIGVVAARTRDYISGLLPDFDEHYRRAEERLGRAQYGGSRDSRTAV